MNARLVTAKQVLVDIPRRLRLAYCLLRDPRVPFPLKTLLASAFGLIVSPVKKPKRFPLLGPIDTTTLTLISLNLFILACPLELVSEHEQKIVERQSIFDEDLRQGEELVRKWIVTVLGLPRDEVDLSHLVQEEVSQ